MTATDGSTFVCSVRAQPLDCDRQGVIAHPSYLRLFEWAMLELWRDALGPYSRMAEQDVDLAVGEVNIQYLGPARFEDILDIGVAVSEFTKSSFVVTFEVRVEGRLVTQGRTRYVCIDVSSKQKRELPAWVRRGLGRFASGLAHTPAN